MAAGVLVGFMSGPVFPDVSGSLIFLADLSTRHGPDTSLSTSDKSLILLVPGERIELPTNGLQNRCSTAELTRLRQRFPSVSFSATRPKWRNGHRLATDFLGHRLPEPRINASGSVSL